tara:strand:+ start:44 stop:259 length:216 start_codon:yes stop_codon:yes gene_type:complete
VGEHIEIIMVVRRRGMKIEEIVSGWNGMEWSRVEETHLEIIEKSCKLTLLLIMTVTDFIPHARQSGGGGLG